MKRVIAIGLSPNTQSDDVVEACKQMLVPWNYQIGSSAGKLEQWFKDYFQVPYAISFSNARSALFVILKSLEIGKGDEIILPAFTCIVVPNAIVAAGAVPVYSDISGDLTLDPKDVEKKITKKTKAILVQHTFGIPTDMEAIQKIAKKYRLFIIEDAAHTIGGTYKEKKLGTFGDAAIFSLGRDKAFSSVFGGMAITNDKVLGEKMRKFQQSVSYPSNSWIVQQLFHPIAFSVILPLYNSGLGKLILVILQKFRLLSFPVLASEKKGVFDQSSIKKFSNALASTALFQLQKLDQYNNRRKEITQKYKKVCDKLGLQTITNQNEILLRFSLITEHPEKLRKFFRQHGKIYLGDWYANVIDPKGSNFSAVNYHSGSCPKAELLASKIINLPTYPVMTDDDVDEVIETLKQYYDRN